MRKKIFLLFFIVLLSFLIFSYADFSLAAPNCDKDKDCPKGERCVRDPCSESKICLKEDLRILEICYPQVPGASTPKYVHTKLADYINYIFRTSIWVIGIIIFGALIYSGVNYLTSFGNPTKLSDAKKGILSAFLGGIILLSAYLIFNTINPQLVILEPAEPKVIVPKVWPGVYLCNYNTDNDPIETATKTTIKQDLDDYMSGNPEKQSEAVKRIAEKMGTPKGKKRCIKATSGSLREITIKEGAKNTIFIVPREDPLNPGNWIWEYGIVLHEKPNLRFTTKCKVLPTPLYEQSKNLYIYRQVDDFHPEIPFDVGSVSVFQKTTPPESEEGVILYEGDQYNQIGKEEEENSTSTSKGYQNLTSIDLLEEILSFCPSVFAQVRDPKLAMKAWKPSGDTEVRVVPAEELKEIFPEQKKEGHPGLYHNTRSIEIDREGSFLAVLFGDENNICDIREKDDPNLENDRIGMCGICYLRVGPTYLPIKLNCYPCLERMYVIKGKKI